MMQIPSWTTLLCLPAEFRPLWADFELENRVNDSINNLKDNISSNNGKAVMAENTEDGYGILRVAEY